jgi:hypothetical protein
MARPLKRLTDDICNNNSFQRVRFVKWHEMAADRNQWRAICGSKMPIATKETPTSSRQNI